MPYIPETESVDAVTPGITRSCLSATSVKQQNSSQDVRTYCASRNVNIINICHTYEPLRDSVSLRKLPIKFIYRRMSAFTEIAELQNAALGVYERRE